MIANPDAMLTTHQLHSPLGEGRKSTPRRGVDLLLLTWNRREYVEKTVPNLFADPADFRVYWWDNGSTDGTADLAASWSDPRIVARRLAPKNVLQAIPTQWFLGRCTGDVIGKVDDDTLVPHGWTETLAAAVRERRELGMIGCWTFWPDDIELHREAALRKVVAAGRHRILRDIAIGGTAFLMRWELAVRYLQKDGDGTVFPIDRIRMTRDGLISGWYYPELWAEHMDDPRSAHCQMNRSGRIDGKDALTARVQGFTRPEMFLEWIKADARDKLTTSVRTQVWRHRVRGSRWYQLLGKVRRFL